MPVQAQSHDAEARGATDARLEIKFVAPPQAYDTLVFLLSRLWIPFVPHHPARIINSLYFDTEDYSCYADNISGVSDRTKLRYRWYGPAEYPDAGVLELKVKKAGSGWKERQSIDRPPLAPGGTWHYLVSALKTQAAQEASIWLNHYPMPVLIVTYRRTYLQTADKRIRANSRPRCPLLGSALRAGSFQKAPRFRFTLLGLGIEVRAAGPSLRQEDHRPNPLAGRTPLEIRDRCSRDFDGLRTALPALLFSVKGTAYKPESCEMWPVGT